MLMEGGGEGGREGVQSQILKKIDQHIFSYKKMMPNS